MPNCVAALAILLFGGTISGMEVTFDPAKDASNRIKHGILLATAAKLEWDTTVTWPDTRKDYGEARQCGIGYVGLMLHFVVFVDRDASRRIISLRKANRKEVKRYAET